MLLLDGNPSLTARDLDEQTGLSKCGIEKQLKKLRELGVVERKGSDKNGQWIINK